MREETVTTSLAPDQEQDQRAPSNTVSVIHIEPEDSLDLLLPALEEQTEPVILVLPERGHVFEHGEDFQRLRSFQEERVLHGKVSFVIPQTREEKVGKLAYQQGFSFSSSLVEAVALLDQSQAVDAYRRHVHGLLQDIPDIPVFSPGPPPPLLRTLPATLEAQVEQDREGPKEPEQPQQQASPPLSPLSPPAGGTRPKQLSRVRVVLMVLVILLLIGAGSYLVPNLLTQSTTLTAVPPVPVGALFFSNSGQLNPISAQGLCDVAIVDLHGITPPASGKALYAWLRPDPGQDEIQPILLGTLEVRAGHAHLTYADPHHNDLLATYSQLLVTEQSAAQAPDTPALDTATWRYQASIPTIPTPGDEKHYTLLDHLRHLLARDVTVASIGLSGGLNIWLYRNSLEIQDEANTARDYWQYQATAFMHRQIVRILDYLDGYNFIRLDIPLIDPNTGAETPFMVDRKMGAIGLLTFDPRQQPPGYLEHLSIHLAGLANSPGATPTQKALASQLDAVITQTVTPLFKKVHDDAALLVKMTGAQLQSNYALDLLNDMATNANAAVAGSIDPTTGTVGKSLTWLVAQLGQLAVVTVTRYRVS